MALAQEHLVELSAQNVVDCSCEKHNSVIDAALALYCCMTE